MAVFVTDLRDPVRYHRGHRIMLSDLFVLRLVEIPSQNTQEEERMNRCDMVQCYYNLDGRCAKDTYAKNGEGKMVRVIPDCPLKKRKGE